MEKIKKIFNIISETLEHRKYKSLGLNIYIYCLFEELDGLFKNLVKKLKDVDKIKYEKYEINKLLTTFYDGLKLKDHQVFVSFCEFIINLLEDVLNLLDSKINVDKLLNDALKRLKSYESYLKENNVKDDLNSIESLKIKLENLTVRNAELELLNVDYLKANFKDYETSKILIELYDQSYFNNELKFIFENLLKNRKDVEMKEIGDFEFISE